MSGADSLLDRLNDVVDELTAVLSSHNRLTVVREVAASVERSGQAELNSMCAEAQDEINATVCLVTLLTDVRQDFLGSAGPFDPFARVNGTDVGQSLCQFVVATGASLRVDDTTTFCAVTPGVGGMAATAMHSYYGEPVFVRGQAIGAFCALDAEVRHWSLRDRQTVEVWAGRTADYLGALVPKPST